MKKLILLSILLAVGCDNSTEPGPEDCAGVAGGNAVEDCAGNCGSIENVELFGICYNIASSDTLLTNGGNTFLCELPPEIGLFNNLIYLQIANLQLTTIPESIGELTKLEILLISLNQISSIPESIGNLSNLKRLWLWSNQLTSLPESIVNLHNLEYLNVMNNQLTTLPESMCNLSIDWSGVNENADPMNADYDYFDASNNSICGELPSCLTTEDIGEQDCP